MQRWEQKPGSSWEQQKFFGLQFHRAEGVFPVRPTHFLHPRTVKAFLLTEPCQAVSEGVYYTLHSPAPHPEGTPCRPSPFLGSAGWFCRILLLNLANRNDKRTITIKFFFKKSTTSNNNTRFFSRSRLFCFKKQMRIRNNLCYKITFAGHHCSLALTSDQSYSFSNCSDLLLCNPM